MKQQVAKETLQQLIKLIADKETITCKLVVTSIKTNTDNTYLIKGKFDERKQHYFLNIAYEDGYNKFTKVAFEMHDRVHYLGTFGSGSSTTIKGAYWLLDGLIRKRLDSILKSATIQHTGTCMKCGRELTDAESIEYGMGKTCRSK
jgi:hypothetical protein